MLKLALSVSALFLNSLYLVHGHGFMKQPAARNWLAKAFPSSGVPFNGDWAGLNCGGVSKQWNVNGGRCGICGDDWSAAVKQHEAGGKYATGFIAQCVPRHVGSIDVVIEITAHHKGWFEFRLCPNDDPEQKLEQECFDAYLLRGIDQAGYNGTRFDITTKKTYYYFTMALPDVECEDCVLQWKYHAGNNWGCDDVNGESICGLGRGNQEEFWNCADISIQPECPEPGSSGGGLPPAQPPPAQENPSEDQSSWENPAPSGDESTWENPSPDAGQTNQGNQPEVAQPVPVPGQKVCTALAYPATDTWCTNNCNHITPNCPASLCNCITVGETEQTEDSGEYMDEDMEQMAEEMDEMVEEIENLKKELAESRAREEILKLKLEQEESKEGNNSLDLLPQSPITRGVFTEEIKVRTCTKKNEIKGYKWRCANQCPTLPSNDAICTANCDCTETVTVAKYRCHSQIMDSLLGSLYDETSEDDYDDYSNTADLLGMIERQGTPMVLCGLYCRTAGIEACTNSVLKCHCELIFPEV